MGRINRILQDEYPYHVSTRSNGRKLVFKRWTYKLIIEVLKRAATKYNVRIHHFKMMSNHYHMKISTPDANISEVMWYINNQISKRYNRRTGETGHLWGNRFSSPIVDSDKYDLRCVRYIYNNGVRAGMCSSASKDDQLSTFEFYARGKRVGFEVTEDEVFLLLGESREERAESFRRMFDDPISSVMEDMVRDGLRRPFFGSEKFVERMKSKYLMN